MLIILLKKNIATNLKQYGFPYQRIFGFFTDTSSMLLKVAFFKFTVAWGRSRHKLGIQIFRINLMYLCLELQRRLHCI